MEFRFLDVPLDVGLERLHERLNHHRWRGQIVGPHGSGKTTLLRTLERYWIAWGRRTKEFALHNGQRSLPANYWSDVRSLHVDTIVVDGFEQLSLFAKFRLLNLCFFAEVGLLVTTHRPTRFLPIVHQSRTSDDLATELVQSLLQNEATAAVSLTGRQKLDLSTRALELLVDHRGNMRETLFSLYDDCQSLSDKA